MRYTFIAISNKFDSAKLYAYFYNSIYLGIGHVGKAKKCDCE